MQEVKTTTDKSTNQSLKRNSLSKGIYAELATLRILRLSKTPSLTGLLKSLGLIGITFFITSAPAKAEITTDQAVQAIVGEAAGESFKGKLALAEALRNRGTLNGVFGYQRKNFIKKQMPYAGEESRKAWQASKYTNLVKGADHWESVDFKTPEWAKDMKETARIGKHRFFKKVQA